MRILFCSKSPLDPRLGGAQTFLALGTELERLGHIVDYVDPPALGTDLDGFATALAGRLRTQVAGYDVVDYDFAHLGASRDVFPADVLFTARVQLLGAQLIGVEVPPLPRLRARLAHRLRHRRDAARRAARARAADRALAQSDLIVVLNTRDSDCLVARGLDPWWVAVIPNGLGPDAAVRLAAVPKAVPEEPPRVAFVGMFSPRKGAGDFPRFFQRLAAAVPDVRLRLLGTRGMLTTAEAVRRLFPRALRTRVEVVPRFWPEELAGHLAPCWAGVFPSYNEGFGLGIIEMLTAALPVVAYDAPGAADLLPPERRVPRGDPDALADALAALLNDPPRLAEARQAARASAAPYRWPAVAAQTAAAYEDALVRLRAMPQPVII